MDEFLMRSLTETNTEYPEIEVTRTRTSNGSSTINIRLGKQNIRISNATIKDGGQGEEYEKVAQQLAESILTVASNRCDLRVRKEE
jgi:hypothetical protein